MRVDTVFRRGNVVTLDPGRPHASAVAVLGDRIVAVGDDDDLAGLTPDRSVDLAGATVVPGFHDAHNHCVFFGMSLAELPLGGADVHGRRTSTTRSPRAAAGDRARRSGSSAPATTRTGWPSAATPPPRSSTGRPRATWSGCGTRPGTWPSSTAPCSTTIGIEGAPVPPGGQVERDGDGRPTGLLLESAQAMVRDLVYPYPLEDIAAAIDRATRHYLTEGITSAQEAGIGAGLVSWSPQELAAYSLARASGRLHVRATLMVAADTLHEVGGSPQDPRHLRPGPRHRDGPGRRDAPDRAAQGLLRRLAAGPHGRDEAAVRRRAGQRRLPAAGPGAAAHAASCVRTGPAGRSRRTPSATWR